MRKLTKGTVTAVIATAFFFLPFEGVPRATAGVADFGLRSTGATLSNHAAGAHGDLEIQFQLTGSAITDSDGQQSPWAAMRDLVIELPPGLLGNPTAIPRCEAARFVPQFGGPPPCPPETQVGVLRPGIFGQLKLGTYATPLYNLNPPPGVTAQLAAVVFLVPVYIDLTLDPSRDGAVTASLLNAPSLGPLTGAAATLWGVPGASGHDEERLTWQEAAYCGGQCGDSTPNEFPIRPFMSNPTSCGPAEVGFAVGSYEQPEGLDYSYASLPDVDECDSVPFEPQMSIAPTTRGAAAPSGLEVDLKVPDAGLENPAQPSSAAVRKARIVLPEGFSFDTSAVDGLGACSEAEAGVTRNERQIIDVGGRGAPLTLTFEGEPTRELPPFASAAEVRTALEALMAIGPGGVTVAGRPVGPWTVEFVGSLGGRDLQAVGGTLSEMQRLSVAGTGGTYSLGLSGHWTAPLALEADAASVQAALEQLPGIGPGQVRVVGGPIGGPSARTNVAFDIAFAGALAGVDEAQLEAKSSLTGSEPLLEVTEVVVGGSPVATHTPGPGGAVRFIGSAPGCPTASEVAGGTLRSPLLRNPLSAHLYLARQGANPYGALLAGYLLAEGEGVRLTLPVRFAVDPQNGQVTATLENRSQLPLTELELQFKGGNRGLFVTPSDCGTYAAGYRLDPSSGGPPVSGESSFTLDRNCGPHAFDPSFRAGSSSTEAGAFTSFLVELLRAPGTPSLTRLAVTMPEGLAAKLAGVARCPDTALDRLPTAPGAGGRELASPACPAAARVGTVTAGIGAGLPTYLDPGAIYLAGPYRGAPLSLVLVVPALAGPFDLGNLAVRAAVSVDPATAQMRIDSDAIPTALAGIPLELRDLRVSIDRPGFLTNPTGCGKQSVTAVVGGGNGVAASVAEPFQVGDCGALSFKPRARLSFSGGVGRNGHPRLVFMLAPRRADANVAAAALTLPAGELIDLRRLPALCPGTSTLDCPRRSRLGSLSLQSPLLDRPFRGPLYARVSEHGLPEVVAVLQSEGFRLVLQGRSSARSGRLSIRFPSIPDIPFSRLRLALDGGRRGFVVNNEPLCGRAARGTVVLRAHNGRRRWFRPEALTDC